MYPTSESPVAMRDGAKFLPPWRPGEEWEVASATQGKLLISTDGRVFNPRTGTMRRTFFRNGYPTIQIRLNNGKDQNFSVHRLVAQEFLSNPCGYPQVNHIDGDKTNNRVRNLEWCTGAMNLRAASAMKLFGQQKIGRTDVLVAFKLRKDGWTQARIAKHLGVARETVRDALNGRTHLYVYEAINHAERPTYTFA